LGIFAAVAEDYPDLLAAEEWRIFQNSPCFAEIRDRIDVVAWKKVWQMRSIAPPTPDFLAAGPVSFLNLLRKQKTTLEFLHVHHNDLKHAIELAGANHHDAQEIWQRVFRDAERAVLKNSVRAFPELSHLDQRYRDFFFWHQRGSLRVFGLNVVPARIASVFGDQDGIFPSGCRQYRNSMNEVAQWAAERKLMDFTGDECIPKNASLLEAYMDNKELLAGLQKKDGYGPTLELSEPLPRDHVPTLEEIEALLRRVPAFAPLRDDEIRELARKVRPKRYGTGERVVKQGQPGASLFVVALGTLEVLVRQTDGHDLPIGSCEPGSVFGETALLMGGERTATVRTVDEAVLYEIGKAHLEPIIKARPQLIVELSVLMANRQADVAKHAQRYSSKQEQVKSVAQRMSMFLLGARTVDDKKAVVTLQKEVGHGRPLGLGERLPAGDILRTDNIETLLRTVPVFKPLTDDEIWELARMAHLIRCRPFDRVVVQGQPGASLFVVASGTLEVLVRQKDGPDLSINSLEPGSVFGETALLMGGERTATVRTVGEAVVYEISKAHLEPIIKARPQLIVELSVLMANRQADTMEKYQQRDSRQEQVKSFSQRIRSFLLGG
jgi:CRP-like cAMP-binding protein